MRRAAVGLYCAVVDRGDLLVSNRAIAVRETRPVCTQRAGRIRTWLGHLNLGSGVGWRCESGNCTATTDRRLPLIFRRRHRPSAIMRRSRSAQNREPWLDGRLFAS